MSAAESSRLITSFLYQDIWGVDISPASLVVFLLYKCIYRSIEGRVAIIVASAYTDATGNGECSVIADVHNTDLCCRIDTKIGIVAA